MLGRCLCSLHSTCTAQARVRPWAVLCGVACVYKERPLHRPRLVFQSVPAEFTAHRRVMAGKADCERQQMRVASSLFIDPAIDSGGWVLTVDGFSERTWLCFSLQTPVCRMFTGVPASGSGMALAAKSRRRLSLVLLMRLDRIADMRVENTTASKPSSSRVFALELRIQQLGGNESEHS